MWTRKCTNFLLRPSGFWRASIRSNQTLTRNVGVIAHIDAGKTTTTEQMLYICGYTNSVGRVDSGDTVMDFLPQEKERGITISSAAISFKWKDINVNLIDTPGHVDFTFEVERSTRVLDGAVLVIDAVAGVQAQTQTVWKQANKQGIPAVAFINKMDRDGASFKRALQSISKKLNANTIAIQYPLGSEDSFVGAVDLLTLRKVVWDSPTSSRTPVSPTITEVSEADVTYNDIIAAQKQMYETIAEHDEEFLNLYLEHEGGTISPSVVISAIRKLSLSCELVPVVCGASLRGKGVEPLLDTIAAFLPSPLERKPFKAVNIKDRSQTKILSSSSEDLCALVFKIVYDKERGPLSFFRVFSGVMSSKSSLRNSTNGNKERINQLLAVSADEHSIIADVEAGNVGCIVGLKHTSTGDTLVSERGPLHDYVLDGLDIPPPVFSISIEPESSSQQAALSKALDILCMEDPSLRVEIDSSSGQTLLKGIGELHLEIVCDKLKREHRLDVYTGKVFINFRESLDQQIEKLEKVVEYDRTFGTKRMFSKLRCMIETIGFNKECQLIIEETAKANCAHDELDALVNGMTSAFSRGRYGYPIMGLRIRVLNVEKDSDTTPGAVRACAVHLVDQLMRSEDHTLLEPQMSIEIDASSKFIGDVLNDLTSKRRASVHEVVNNGQRDTIIGSVPLSTMLGYATAIRSMTQGEGQFSMEYHDYCPVDAALVNDLL